MDVFCKGCKERGTDNCSLPDIGEKLGDLVHFLGQELLTSAASGSVARPIYIAGYSEQLRLYRSSQLEERQQRIINCIDRHQGIVPDVVYE